MKRFSFCAFTAVVLAGSAAAGSFLRTHAPAFWGGNEFPGAKGHVELLDGELRLHYDFGGGGRYVSAGFKLPERPHAKRIAFEANLPDTTEMTVRIVDSTKQTFQYHFSGSTDGEWAGFSFNTGEVGIGRGGAGDGRLHLPLVEFSVLAENTGGAAGVLRVRNIQLFDTLETPQKVQEQTFAEAVTEAGNLRHELARALPELERKGLGAKTRASLAVMDYFHSWILEDAARGFTNRAAREARELVTVGRDAKSRLEAIARGEIRDCPVPHFVTGPVETSHAQIVGTREWPDGRRERGNVMLTGFGHFGMIQREQAKMPLLGNHILQMEIGPWAVLTGENTVKTNGLAPFFKAAEIAAKENVQICLLLSPHYFPKWALEKWPHLSGCAGGFFKYCVHDECAQSVIEKYLRTVIPLVRGNPALHSICLSNEPAQGYFGADCVLRKRWPKWLEKRHGTLEAMNGKWGTDYASFADVPMPKDYKKNPATPATLDFIRFNRESFAAFHKRMADVIRELAPELPVHSKVMIFSDFGPNTTSYSVDPAVFAKLGAYNGNDAYFDYFGDRQYKNGRLICDNTHGWAHKWWEMEAGYDFQRSAADTPVFNSENHVIADREKRYIPGRHVYAALWQNAVHGQSATTLWEWERTFDDGRAACNGLILERPVCLAAWAHAALDLSRLVDQLAPIQNQEPAILLFRSLSSEILGKKREFISFYRAASFLGQQLGVVTEDMLSEFSRTGVKVRPLASARVVLLPGVTHLPDAARDGLKKLEAQGVKVFACRAKPAFDDCCRPRNADDFPFLSAPSEMQFARLFDELSEGWNLPDCPRVRSAKSEKGIWGVESHGYRTNGISRITFINHLWKPVRIRLEAPGYDLLSGKVVPEEIDLPSGVPMFVEYREKSLFNCSRWVNPLIGTSATGHAFPAACVPFGLVQAGPDTGNGSWHYCSGYRYEDKTICGFSQTHLNGTGCPDLGDLRILPFRGELAAPSTFDHAEETAMPGYYGVRLKDAACKVEIAAAGHSAIYRIKNESGESLKILVDCAYGITDGNMVKEIYASDIKLDGKCGLAGTNRRRKWVDRAYSFVVEFNREALKVEELPKVAGQTAPQYVFAFDGSEEITMKLALSAEGDVAAAAGNLAAEIPAWDFDAVKRAARARWNEVLGRATIEGTDDQKKNWYTSLYHLFIQPNNIADVGAKPFYSTLSTWDTFRAAHPLYTILATEKAAEFVDSMLEQGRRTGYLPIWTLWGKDNQCMIGTHSIPVIVDWFLKDFHCRKEHKDSASLRLCVKNKSEYWLSAYAQIKDTLTKPHKGRVKERWDLLDKYGYYPFDEIKGESVSRTMECAYDDWCAGVMAEKLGFKADAEFFFKRSGNWKNVFDSSIGFARGKDSKGRWRTPFNPFALSHGAGHDTDFTEGSAFQYSWHVMQDVPGLVAAMGGRAGFVKRLDELFTAPSKTEGMGEVLDVTGLIGQYVHGNEPSHHVIYFYPQVGHPEKAAARIREVFDRFYLPKPDGLCGNDDCGQMSAWYVFSAMGFYPFNPCGGEYVIGAPQLPRVTLNLANGKMFTVTAKGLSRKNKYVKSVRLNGKPVKNWKIHHSDIVRGGELIYEMSDAL